MRINKKAFFIVFGISSLLYGGVLYFSPLPAKQMDRDNSGLISITEAISSLEIGERIVSDKPNCIEYYWLKDGLTVYEKCTE